ncbi:MAG: hypothetical protein CMF71_07365 [Magnetovibrio sp.]|nr:hypothetical protein [Magnetovibrio sp.]|tara:strand:+ start:24004 stop:25917 length:1914 start_codon:yes stop_codon:yes gene_type:complete
MIFLDYFFLNEPQFTTALFTGLFLLISTFIGINLGRQWVEGTVWGFLVLSGSANLAVFLSRGFDLPTSWYGILVLIIVLVICPILRQLCFCYSVNSQHHKKSYILILILFTTIIWAGNIIHPFPDSGFSSHHGVVPLYIQESFALGHFVTIKDTAFGEGLMTSLFYPADLLGLVALSGWLGTDEVYPAFNAGSITASILTFAILSSSIRNHRLALITFFFLTIINFSFNSFFRTALGGNWGDVLMYLCGALVCYYLSQSARIERAFLIGAVASIFLVFSRHYGAFYSAFIIAICFFISLRTQKNWNIRPWLVVGALWCIFSFRELYYLFGNFTQYYPGSWQLERRQLNIEELFLGSLTDWGLIDGSSLSFSSISIRSLYILVLAISVWRAFILKKIDVEWMISVFAPFVVLLAPLALQILTGYRTNSLYSKTYILGIFFFAWYPAYLLTHSDLGQFTSLLGRQYNRIATILMFLTLGWIVVDRVGVKNIYKSNLEKSLEQVFSDSIPDREIVAVLRRELSSVELNEVIGNPIMYLYYEPGTSLRLYLGGEFLKDIDFWSVPVREKILISKSFKELLHHLNYPNVYIGLMKNGKVPDFGFPVKASLISEIENYSSASWFKQAFKYKNAMFFITQKPVH